MTVQPFHIQIPQAQIDNLRQRLSNTRFPDEVNGADWDYGTNLGYLKELITYWQTTFDWRKQEAMLNELPHYRATIQGTGIHFIHVRGKGENAIPLLMMHGWPSSFVQMLKIIPMLTDPLAFGGSATDTFDVIVPSLPGYGFSDRPVERGMSVARIAALFHELMTTELGYTRYATRSSDLGAGVATQLAITHPEALIGTHTSGTNPYIAQIPDNLSAAEQAFVQQAQTWMMQEMAYAMEHTSKPQTLAYGLNDSPAGLAGWIIEKFRRWSDCAGQIENRFSKDELLTNLTIYWLTETINSSMRLYYETARDPGQWGSSQTPTAIIMPKNDLFPTPREWVERTGPIARWTDSDKGGHFLEWEEPLLVAQDLRAFFGELRTS